jgi:hypothetical protein
MTEQQFANCISMDGNEETVAVEWPRLRKRVFDFLCRCQWRVGERPTCFDQYGNEISIEAATPDWLEFSTRRFPLPVKFVLPDTDIGASFEHDEAVLCIAPIYGVWVTHDWWIRNPVQMSAGLPNPMHSETWHWTEEGLVLPIKKKVYLH